MKLARYINNHLGDILAEWDAFALTLQPAAAQMTKKALRDHAQQILTAIAKDIETGQSAQEQQDKSQGLAPEDPAIQTAAATHGTLREISGFTLVQLVAEYRALRATVLRLWLPHAGDFNEAVAEDVVRFNEAVDQALAESAATYSEHATRTRDTFLAILGHDLRTPLAAISMAGELLERTPDANAERNVITGRRLRRSAATMSTMVNDLLEYARTQLGAEMPVTRVPADLREIYLAALHDASAAHPDCEFRPDLSGDLHGEFDSVRMQQLITNLLTNAAQYRSEGTPVEVAAHGEDGFVTLTVSNQGPAIPETSLATIFNPLVQLPVDADQPGRPATSLGLGLFIAQEITLAHGGTISVTSTEEAGTSFTVRLPGTAQA